MRSDSPRVAAAQESRRSSVNTVGAASKRLSLDKEFLENNLVSALGAAYDSPTLLPRKPIIPDSLMSSGSEQEQGAACHSTKEEDQSSTLSMTDTSSTHEDAPAHHEKNMLSKAIDVMMARVKKSDDSSSDTDDEMLSSIKDNALLEDRHLKFDLNIPPPMMDTPTIHFVCETASRLLFQTLHWTKSIPAFNLLKYESQVGLVRNSWSDLFVLGLAQISGQVAIPSLLSIIVSHQQSRLARDNTPINVKEVTASICKIHDYVQTLSKLNISATEFAYLRSIALFGADHHCVEALQDRAVAELEDATSKAHPGDRNRFPRLLLLLSPLRSLHPETLEDLFFSGLIGNIQIDSVIPYILKMEPKEYQNHLGGSEQEEASSSPEPGSPGSPVKREEDKESEDMDSASSQLKVEVSLSLPTENAEK